MLEGGRRRSGVGRVRGSAGLERLARGTERLMKVAGRVELHLLPWKDMGWDQNLLEGAVVVPYHRKQFYGLSKGATLADHVCGFFVLLLALRNTGGPPRLERSPGLPINVLDL